jgi:hypothetical protein
MPAPFPLGQPIVVLGCSWCARTMHVPACAGVVSPFCFTFVKLFAHPRMRERRVFRFATSRHYYRASPPAQVSCPSAALWPITRARASRPQLSCESTTLSLRHIAQTENEQRRTTHRVLPESIDMMQLIAAQDASCVCGFTDACQTGENVLLF